MEGEDIVCNFAKCRKPLTDFAYVTACSHIFCDEDGTRSFNKSTICPACQTNLSNKFEIVRNNLQPSEQYKSMILAGLKPDVICEITNRALAFWVYQSHQEKTYQEYVATRAKERSAQQEKYYEEMVSRITTELNLVKSQLSSAKNEVEETKKKYNDLSDKLMEKSRQHQKLQSMYDSLRRKFIRMSSFGPDEDGLPANVYKVQSLENLAASCATGNTFVNNSRARHPSPANSFELNPVICDIEPDIRVQKKFSVNLGTPRQ